MNDSDKPLRKGWTTGACATAAATAAAFALRDGAVPDRVTIDLPKGLSPTFAVERGAISGDTATATVIKDAGDDPDITHGAALSVTLRPIADGPVFVAGDGVGTVTKPGLPIPPGEPAINPGPRAMITANVTTVLGHANVEVTVNIENGAKLAPKTMNPRLGIVGGLSVLGTTGVVVPYSCSAWIASIRQGVDVARAEGLRHIAATTGRTSEAAVQALLKLPDTALIEMGDFAGGVLKYLRDHPVPCVTLGGGFAKLAKLAAGEMDLHSKRSSVDVAFLAQLAREAGASEADASAIADCETGAQGLIAAGDFPLADVVAARARLVALEVLRAGESGGVENLDVMIFDRNGQRVGYAA